MTEWCDYCETSTPVAQCTECGPGDIPIHYCPVCLPNHGHDQ